MLLLLLFFISISIPIPPFQWITRTFSIVTQQKINALIYATDVAMIITLIELILKMDIALKIHEL